VTFGDEYQSAIEHQRASAGEIIMSGKKITIPTSDDTGFGAYMAIPEGGKGPGMVILQEIFGVNHHIRAVADLYAEEGYVAVAPDLFWRIEPGIELEYTAEGREKAMGLYQRFDGDMAVRDIVDTIKALRAMAECSGKAGVVGFCLGGRLAFVTAARTDVDAAACYYPTAVEPSLGEAASIKCPIVVHMGGQDRVTPPPLREKVKAVLSGHERAEVYVYADAGHGFSNWHRDSFHPFSALLAYSRTIRLMRSAIGPR
jgi:carboxymethylenebutenolidase